MERFTSNRSKSALIRKVIVYSLPLLPYWLVGYLSGNYVDAFFITKFLSKADLGVYSIAALVNGSVMQIPTLANTILLPLFLTKEAESSNTRSFIYFRHIMPGLVLVWGIFCAVLAVFGYLMVPLVFQPEFGGAVLPMWILLAGSVFWIPVAVGYAAYANAISATYISLAASCVTAAINIAGDVTLIPRYGMAGSAWATFAAYGASALVFAVLLKRRAETPISWTFLAFTPSALGAVIITYYGLPLWALTGCIVSSLVIGMYKRASIIELVGFASGFWRSANGPN